MSSDQCPLGRLDARRSACWIGQDHACECWDALASFCRFEAWAVERLRRRQLRQPRDRADRLELTAE
jgi:hypothetical protein